MTDDQESHIVKAVTDNIFAALHSQEFKDWFENRFESFVQGDLEQEFGTESYLVAKTLVKQDIHRMFNIV